MFASTDRNPNESAPKNAPRRRFALFKTDDDEREGCDGAENDSGSADRIEPIPGKLGPFVVDEFFVRVQTAP
jgi:hypothetical protein